MQLTREVRFQITGDTPPSEEVLNPWAGWPADIRAGPYVVVRAAVAGQPDERTGYICNIALIDQVVRRRALPAANRLWAASFETGGPAGDALLGVLWEAIRDDPPAGTTWKHLECRITPFLSFAIDSEDWSMIHVTQSFEFSAAHRLHCPDLSDDENRRIFGKCNNPNGHGHNYQLEVTVTGDGQDVALPAFERVVKTEIIDRFDHKHLNEDCDEFAALNPSVENITRVIWDRLAGAFDPLRLRRLRLWETPKTYAEYTGSDRD